MCLVAIQLVVLLSLIDIYTVNGQTCNCNLVQGLCESNCCCDTVDCSTNDTLIFSTCLPAPTDPTSFLCSFDQTRFFNNVAVITTVESNSLFCVETDNFAQRNLYTDPECVLSNTCFDAVGPTYTYASTSGGDSSITPTTLYRTGDTMFIRYSSGEQNIFTTPAKGVSTSCQDNVPVTFYTNRMSTCTRILNSIASSCTSTESLDYSTYFQGFELYTTPPSNSSSLGLLNITIASCKIDGVEFGSSCASPEINGNNCANVVNDVSFLITTNDLEGIVAATVSFTLKQINAADLPLSQTFSVNFQQQQPANTSEQVLQKSGNPGYLVGKPLNTAAQGQGDATILPFNVSQNIISGSEISLINPDPSGLCSNSWSQTRLPILFGNDVRTGCLMPVDGLTCSALQERIKFVLDGPTFSAFSNTAEVFVGTFGNSSIHSLATLNAPSEWIQVVRGVYSANPSDGISGCSGMVLSSRYEILFGNSGSITNPQAKILGVRYSYGDPQFTRFQCLKGSCNNIASTQNLEIYTSVNFIDISQTPAPVQRQRPRVIANLPSDFFFPLKGSGNAHPANIGVILTFMLLCVCLSFGSLT